MRGLNLMESSNMPMVAPPNIFFTVDPLNISVEDLPGVSIKFLEILESKYSSQAY
jgi:hypothetical protein